MKRIFAFSITFLLTQACLAAPATPMKDEWGKKHADESVLILEYSNTNQLNKDFSYSETAHIIERIQNEAGMSEGEQRITYNARHDKVRFIKAHITLPDGKKYSPKMIQDVDTAGDGMYSDIRQKIITMPNVVPGSVIDIEYEIFHRQGPLKGNFFASIAINAPQPENHAFFKLIVPDGIDLYFKETNTDRKPVVTSAKGSKTYLWESRNDEDYDQQWGKENNTPPYLDTRPFIAISTIKDWSTFADTYAALFSKAVASSPRIKEDVKGIIQGKNSDIEKIEAIHKYIYDQFRYVQIAFDDHDFIPHLATEVFQNKFGDCKDQSILFITMLKEAGIKAYPVLIRKETQGDFRKILPATEAFSHAIVAIPLNGKTIFVDTLVKGYRAGEIPYGLEGDYALVLDGQGGQALQVPYMPLEHKTEGTKLWVKLAADGSAHIRMEHDPSLDDSISLRQRLKVATDEEKKEILERIENLTRGGKLVSYKIEGLEGDHGPVTVKIETIAINYAKPMGPFMILNGLTDFGAFDNFTDKTRKYPVWLNMEKAEENTVEYTIPDSFRFEYVPKSVSLKSDFLDMDVSYERHGRVVRRSERSHYKMTSIPPAKYQEFKDYLLKCEQVLGEVIVIRKH